VFHRGEGTEGTMTWSALIAAALFFSAACAGASGTGEDEPTDAPGIHVIVIRSGSLDVSVSGAENGTVSLHAETAAGSFLDDEPAVRVLHRRQGARLRVWVENDGLFESSPTGQVRISTPRDADIVVETSSGRVSVDGMSGGKCSVRTISGRIRVHHARGRLSMSSVSGSIDMDAAEGSVDARTVSGGIRGRGLTLTGDSSFSSVSGNIEMQLDSGVEMLAYDLKSVSGSITIGSIRAERGLRMGFGGPLVKGHTVSGALSFR
jgi:hypothetical protein